MNLIRLNQPLKSLIYPSLFAKRCLTSASSTYTYEIDGNAGNFEKKHYENRQKNEPIEQKRQRLLYQSRKRGMLENDLLLSTFAKKYLYTMNDVELNMYDHLINTISNDWDLYYYATGKKPIPEEYRNSMMEKFSVHVKNSLREQRLRQPDL